MVAPKAPEGGWKKWFLDHPYQRTRYPIPRNPKVWDAHEESGPIVPQRFEFVEMWYTPQENRVYASLNGQSQNWLRVSDPALERLWDDAVRDLFDYCLAKETTPTPPEPSGSGWDDFDWSR